MSQENEILNHLQRYGSLTPLTALKRFGCFSLSARIFNLRREGYEIKTLIVEEHNKRYAKYILQK